MKKIMLIIMLCSFISILNAQTKNHKIEAFEKLVACQFDAISQKGEIDTIDNIKAYPNPFNTLVTVELTEDETISVYDFQGKFIFEFKSECNKITIDMSEQKSGAYILRIKNESIKIIKR